MKDKTIDGKKTVTKFRSKLVKMIKDADSKFYVYSVSAKIKQIILYWVYELTDKNFYWLDKSMYKNELLLV